MGRGKAKSDGIPSLLSEGSRHGRRVEYRSSSCHDPIIDKDCVRMMTESNKKAPAVPGLGIGTGLRLRPEFDGSFAGAFRMPPGVLRLSTTSNGEAVYRHGRFVTLGGSFPNEAVATPPDTPDHSAGYRLWLCQPFGGCAPSVQFPTNPLDFGFWGAVFDYSHGIRPLVIWCRTLLGCFEVAPMTSSDFHNKAGVLRSLSRRWGSALFCGSLRELPVFAKRDRT